MTQSIETQFFSVVYDIKDIHIIDQITDVIDDTYKNIIQIFNLKKDKYLYEGFEKDAIQSLLSAEGKFGGST